MAIVVTGHRDGWLVANSGAFDSAHNRLTEQKVVSAIGLILDRRCRESRIGDGEARIRGERRIGRLGSCGNHRTSGKHFLMLRF
ncbi:MAG TPA: hypothetical protein VGN33_09385, partial [Leifsonia sp.]|nr:hypothetical protein [Leifsonia sp.]